MDEREVPYIKRLFGWNTLRGQLGVRGLASISHALTDRALHSTLVTANKKIVLYSSVDVMRVCER